MNDRPDQPEDHMPDIDAGLDGIAQEATVADLMREKGQRRRVKVMKEKALRGFIREAIGRVIADNSARIGDEERENLMRETEAKLAEVMKRAQDVERERERLKEEAKQKDKRINDMMVDASLSEEHESLIKELQNDLARARQIAEDARADMLVVEQDAENMRRTLEASVAEKEEAHRKSQNTMRLLTMHTTDLVQGVLDLDAELYESRHQQDNPADEQAEGMDEFFHDFSVCAQVITTLSDDLRSMRSGMEALRERIAESEAEAEAAALAEEESGAERPSLMAADLALLEQVKSSSLEDIDLAAPVDNLIEAMDGVRQEIGNLRLAAADAGAPLHELPDADGDAAEVLAGATRVAREMASVLAGLREQVGASKGAAPVSDEQQRALRDQMIRSGDLVQAVLSVDNDHYAGQHQSENPPPESDDPQEAFYNDFKVCTLVMQTLADDLDKLKGITAALKDATGADFDQADADAGQLGHDLELLHQVKEGSLNALDVAAPVSGLVEALDGARTAMAELQQDTAEAVPGESTPLTAVPDADGAPAPVLAGATQVVRELAAALANERRRFGALKALADDADQARAQSEAEVEPLRQWQQELCDELAAKAEAFGQTAPPALTDPAAAPEERSAAAHAVIAALEPGLGGEAAASLRQSVDEVCTANAVPVEADSADEDELQALNARITALGAALAAAKAQSATAGEEAGERLMALERERDEARESLTKLETERDEARAQLTKLEAERDGDREGLTTLEAERDEARDKLASLEAERDQALAQVNEIEAERDRLRGELENGEQRSSEAATRAAQLESELAELTAAEQELTELVAAKAAAFGIEISPDLTSPEATPAARAAEAKSVLERLQPGLSGEQVAELGSQVDAAIGDQADVIDEPADDLDEMGRLLARVASLKTAMDALREERDRALDDADAHLHRSKAAESERSEAQRSREAAELAQERAEAAMAALKEEAEGYQRVWQGSRERERALAEQVKRLARELEPVLADPGDDQSRDQVAQEIEDEIAQVEEALQSEPDDGIADGQDPVAERLGQLIDGLAERSRVSAEKPRADADKLKLVAMDIVDLARVRADETSDQDVIVLPEDEADADESQALGARQAPDTDVDPEQLDVGMVLQRGKAQVQELVRRQERLQRQLREQREKVDTLRGEKRAAEERYDEDMARYRRRIDEIEEQAQAAAAERDQQTVELQETKDNLLGMREIMSQRIEKEQVATARIEELEGTLADAQQELAQRKERLEHAEQACQQYSEALGELAKAVVETRGEGEGNELVDAARVDLEVTLSELPDEDGIPVRDDLSRDLAIAGTQLLTGLREEQLAAHQRLTDLQEQLDAAATQRESLQQAKRQSEEQVGELKAACGKLQAQLDNSRTEIDRLGDEVAERSREAGDLRHELASTRAELEAQRSQAADRQAQIEELDQQVAELDRVQAELREARADLDTARKAQRDIAVAVDKLADISGKVVDTHKLGSKKDTTRFVKSRSQLDEANRSEQTGTFLLADRGKAVLEELQGQISLVDEQLAQRKTDVEQGRQQIEDLQQRLSATEASIADRDNQIHSLSSALDEARQQADARQGRLGELEQELAQQQDELVEAQSGLEALRASQEAGSENLSKENRRLKSEIGQAQSQIDDLENRLASIDEDHDMELAAVRAQKDEARRQVGQRDDTIRDLQAQLDQAGGTRADIADLQAQIEALRGENTQHVERIRELEQLMGSEAGASGRVNSLIEELDQVKAHRDDMQSRMATLEDDLIALRSNNEGLKAALDRNRAENDRKVTRLRTDLTDLQNEFDENQEELKVLREEKAGLAAKLRYYQRKEDG